MDEHEDKEITLARLKYDYEAGARKERLAFYSAVFTLLIQLVTPIMLYYTHQDTISKMAGTRQAVEQSAEQIDQKATASLLQWKAWTTKEPDDVAKAAESLEKADKMP